MIVKVLALAALVKLAAAYSVAIPRITKDLDGTKIDIDVQVDIDTGEYGQAEAPAPAPTGPGGRVTKPEFEISTVTQDLCNLDGEGLNGCKNGGVCYSELHESGIPLYKCRCVGPWTGPVCDVPVEGSTPLPTIIDTWPTTSSPSPLSTYPDYGSSSTTPPEICLAAGDFCTSFMPHSRPCCDGLVCSMRPSRCIRPTECKKEKEIFLGSYPGDCTKCCSKKCKLEGFGFMEKYVVCMSKNYTRPTPTFECKKYLETFLGSYPSDCTKCCSKKCQRAGWGAMQPPRHVHAKKLHSTHTHVCNPNSTTLRHLTHPTQPSTQYVQLSRTSM